MMLRFGGAWRELGALAGALALLAGCSSGSAAPASSAAVPAQPRSSAAPAAPAASASAGVSTSASSAAASAASASAAWQPSAAGVSSPAAGLGAAAQPSNGDWPTYHHDLARSGIGAATPAFNTVKQVWSAAVDGDVYAEPLLAGKTVYVATENDSVYALDAGSGSVLWQKRLGEPVPRSQLPCGNIDPSGITSTPAIDVARKELYVVGRVQPIHHELFVLDLATGAEKSHRAVDPPGADPKYLQERSALSVANSRVYIPFGGNFGDCGPYKGWVVAVPAAGGGDLLSFSVPTRREGAIWAPPGAAMNGSGDLYVATGNAESGGQFDYANAVIRLSPELKIKDYWAPADWQALSHSDTDIGSVSPTLLQDNQIFQTGKNGVGYLLRADNLGKVGGEIFKSEVCAAAFGGTAYQPPIVYVPCVDGLVAVRVSPGKFDVAWRAPGGRLNSPIVAYGNVWSIDTGSGNLLQISPADGSVRNRYRLPTPVVAHFITPTAAGGKVYAASGKSVLAFGP